MTVYTLFTIVHITNSYRVFGAVLGSVRLNVLLLFVAATIRPSGKSFKHSILVTILFLIGEKRLNHDD